MIQASITYYFGFIHNNDEMSGVVLINRIPSSATAVIAPASTWSDKIDVKHYANIIASAKIKAIHSSLDEYIINPPTVSMRSNGHVKFENEDDYKLYLLLFNVP